MEVNLLYMKTDIHFFLSFLPHFFLEWEMFQTKFVEKIKTHILCSVIFIRKPLLNERMWKNTVERGRPQMTVWRMRIACWVTKTSVFFSVREYKCRLILRFNNNNNNKGKNTFTVQISFPRQQWLRERASVLRYTYVASLISEYTV